MISRILHHRITYRRRRRFSITVDASITHSTLCVSLRHSHAPLEIVEDNFAARHHKVGIFQCF